MLSLIQSLRTATLSAANTGKGQLQLLNSAIRCPQLDQTAGKRTLESRLGLPERPKKPLSPYFRFMSEIRPTVVAANPNLRFTEIVSQIGARWKLIDESKKAAYQEAYKREQIVYLKERAAYEAQLTDAHRFAVADLKQQLADQRTKIAERKRVRELGRPKRAQSPYLCWLNEQRSTGQLPRLPDEPFRDWQRRSAQKWQAMSDAEKRPFVERSSAAFDRYNDELLQWEEKMVRQGNVELVRSNMLVDPVEKLSSRTAKRSGVVGKRTTGAEETKATTPKTKTPSSNSGSSE